MFRLHASASPCILPHTLPRRSMFQRHNRSAYLLPIRLCSWSRWHANTLPRRELFLSPMTLRTHLRRHGSSFLRQPVFLLSKFLRTENRPARFDTLCPQASPASYSILRRMCTLPLFWLPLCIQALWSLKQNIRRGRTTICSFEQPRYRSPLALRT